jgi:hypothetical protein
MVPEGELDVCPWASGLEVAGDHVIMPIQLEQAQKIIGQIVALAAQLELVCFDPQAGKVLPAPALGEEARRFRHRLSSCFRAAASSNAGQRRLQGGRRR